MALHCSSQPPTSHPQATCPPRLAPALGPSPVPCLLLARRPSPASTPARLLPATCAPRLLPADPLLASHLLAKSSRISTFHTSHLHKELTLVRNIPDINQISTREKCWNQVDRCSTGDAKFDRVFPSLSGEKKNQNLEKTDFYGSQNNLTSGQAPATLCQPPASLLPAQRAPAAQPAARKPPTCQPPTCQPGSRQTPAHPACHLQTCRRPPTRLPPGHLPAPWAPANCQLLTRVPGPTPQPTKTHHDTQPIRKVP
ncbi:hypothetical protein DSO57_1032014 [Entomophthora muscae]|uniref:Uncharacterized protein n=1 Tax=Entomophthora muscae TaxID=34485 RepID=A0ACC2T0P2_9FUNG|nr:hypothetical protein DSO57_1032014 [Entomophthora muscae]